MESLILVEDNSFPVFWEGVEWNHLLLAKNNFCESGKTHMEKKTPWLQVVRLPVFPEACVCLPALGA